MTSVVPAPAVASVPTRAAEVAATMSVVTSLLAMAAAAAVVFAVGKWTVFFIFTVISFQDNSTYMNSDRQIKCRTDLQCYN